MSATTPPFGPRTRAIHAGSRRSQYAEMAEALFMTQGFRYASAEEAEARFQQSGPDEFIYARYGNPTSRVFEDRMAALEGTEDAFATASGMAAVHGALFSFIRPGDRVVAARALFGSCLYVLDLLAAFGVDVDYVDGSDLDDWRAALSRPAKAVFFETMANPTLGIVDIAGVAALAREAGAITVVDNVFSTPVFSRAVELGADVVVYSATKHIDGTGRAMGGLILGSRDFVRNTAEPFLKHTGGAISPFNAWLMLGGLTTMDLRVRAMATTAQALAEALARRPGLRVIYPGLASHAQHDLVQRLQQAHPVHHARAQDVKARMRRIHHGLYGLLRHARVVLQLYGADLAPRAAGIAVAHRAHEAAHGPDAGIIGPQSSDFLAQVEIPVLNANPRRNI